MMSIVTMTPGPRGCAKLARAAWPSGRILAYGAGANAMSMNPWGAAAVLTGVSAVGLKSCSTTALMRAAVSMAMVRICARGHALSPAHAKQSPDGRRRHANTHSTQDSAVRPSDILLTHDAFNDVPQFSPKAGHRWPAQFGRVRSRTGEQNAGRRHCAVEMAPTRVLGNRARRVRLRQHGVRGGCGCNSVQGLCRGPVGVQHSGTEERCSLDANVDDLRVAQAGA